MRREIDLPTGYFGALRLIASKEGRTTDEVMREALDAFLGKHGINAASLVAEALPSLSQDENSALLLDLLEAHWALQPKDLTPEEEAEIDRDIDETIREVRAEMAAKQRTANA